MAPRLRLLISSGSKKREPRCVCLSEAKASHSHRMWTEVSSTVPQHKLTTSSWFKKKEPECVFKKKCSKSSIRVAPLHVLPTGSLCSVSRANGLLIHFYLSESPKRSPPTKCMENIHSPSTEPHADRRSMYNGVRPGSPRGSFMTLLSLPQCHAAFSIPSTLAWVDQSPISQCVL
jgi:hypothetical protein